MDNFKTSKSLTDLLIKDNEPEKYKKENEIVIKATT